MTDGLERGIAFTVLTQGFLAVKRRQLTLNAILSARSTYPVATFDCTFKILATRSGFG